MVTAQENYLTSVKNDGSKLRLVKKQTREMISEALSQNGMFLKFVKNINDEIALEAVSNNGLALQYVFHQTLEIALAAVSQNGSAIKYVYIDSINSVLMESWKKEPRNVPEVIISAAYKNTGDDLLNIASSENLIAVVESLLSKKINIDHTSKTCKSTPFQLASKSGNPELMRILESHGANIHIKNNKSQRNVLAEIVQSAVNYPGKRHIAAVTTLLDMGIDPNEKDVHGITAVILAENKPEILSIFKAYNIKKLVQETISASQSINTNKRQGF
jgi:ankyrin repeat protein